MPLNFAFLSAVIVFCRCHYRWM